ncbi:MAG: TonB-dependent receptor plug domain-containing protein [Xanthomonadales bacterium]|nr:TonB-dependent receptor plug domain-containing protein [Xanthomonadales bacterium]
MIETLSLLVLLAAQKAAPPPRQAAEVVAVERESAGEASVQPALRLASLPRIEVVGTPERGARRFGGAATVGAEEIARIRPLTVNELLRRLPGVMVRDEEGFGLRPNIAIRGLNPTRSTKVTLLEDGLPLAYAPYGDNASYFHPQIERYRQVEVLKGVETLLFGPQTIGGVINYLTSDPLREFEGRTVAAGGNRSFRELEARLGGAGLALDAFAKRGAGARENLEHDVRDLGLKALLEFGSEQALILRASLHREDSMVTYSGLTQAEFERLGPRYNPFRNDRFEVQRTGASATHRLGFGDGELLTSLYRARFERDWWRQSSNSQDGQHAGCNQTLVIDGVSATFTQHRLAGRRVDPSTQFPCTQGRLREYDTYGIEPRLRLPTARGEWLAGLRWHRERQDRLQVNGSSPLARSGATVEDNRRDTEALSAFLGYRFALGEAELMPVLRRERVDGGAAEPAHRAARGDDGRAQPVRPRAAPSARRRARAVRELAPRLRAAAGRGPDRQQRHRHRSRSRGLAQPRARPARRLRRAAALRALLVPQRLRQPDRGRLDRRRGDPAVAGRGPLLGTRARARLAVARAGGRTASRRHLAADGAPGDALRQRRHAGSPSRAAPPACASPTRRVTSPRSRCSSASAPSRATSRRSSWVGTSPTSPTPGVPTADGQRGEIPGTTVYHATLHAELTPRVGAFLAVKNLFDKVYIVDRTRGIQTGMPRHLQLGLRYDF